ncbi:Protein N-acetyltransferase, RimJ/RimL family [Sphingobium faniae]|nr:Protein N-acetyltransferase, RimJ/RimL family [Sphingobium faniae]
MFARTPRLLLRPGWKEDAIALAQVIGDPAILRNLTGAPSPYGPQDAEAFLSMPQDSHQPRLLIFARTRGAPRLVGGCGIERAADGKPELGYWIARPCWGLGFATEATRALLGMARANGVRGLRAAHFADNPASGHVLRKLGFHFTGRIETRRSPGRGGAADCLIFEEGEASPMPVDPALDIYRDAMPALAA